MPTKKQIIFITGVIIIIITLASMVGSFLGRFL